jgi:hypothetical protein
MSAVAARISSGRLVTPSAGRGGLLYLAPRQPQRGPLVEFRPAPVADAPTARRTGKGPAAQAARDTRLPLAGSVREGQRFGVQSRH